MGNRVRKGEEREKNELVGGEGLLEVTCNLESVENDIRISKRVPTMCRSSCEVRILNGLRRLLTEIWDGRVHSVIIQEITIV